MHMGALATIGQTEVPNFKHILINNGCHDSVGGQPTVGFSQTFDFLEIGKACGYRSVSLRMQCTKYYYLVDLFLLPVLSNHMDLTDQGINRTMQKS